MLSAHGAGCPAHHAAPATLPPDRRAPTPTAAPREAVGRPAAGNGARRWPVARADIPPRAQRDDGGDRVTRGSRGWSGRPAPSGARDALARPAPRTPGSDSVDLDAGEPAAARAESCASGPQLPPTAPPGRAASPPGSHRTPGAETFPRKRAPPTRNVCPGRKVSSGNSGGTVGSPARPRRRSATPAACARTR